MSATPVAEEVGGRTFPFAQWVHQTIGSAFT